MSLSSSPCYIRRQSGGCMFVRALPLLKQCQPTQAQWSGHTQRATHQINIIKSCNNLLLLNRLSRDGLAYLHGNPVAALATLATRLSLATPASHSTQLQQPFAAEATASCSQRLETHFPIAWSSHSLTVTSPLARVKPFSKRCYSVD